MEFIYPEYSNPTHIITNEVGSSEEYPTSLSYYSNNAFDQDIGIQSGSYVVVIRENVGYNCDWCYVKSFINENDSYSQSKNFYILKNNLQNIGNKQTYDPICSDINAIDPAAPEINPYLKELFLPYIDKKNGLYSVRISVDYEKIIDMKLFKKVLEQVYFEGVNLLLTSRGFRSDNETIINLRSKYYTFAYIHKDFDLTVRRFCEPLTFTVSIPLNFFNASQTVTSGPSTKKASRFLSFTNLNFVDKIDSVINILTFKRDDLEKALFPNKILENFVLEFELNSLRRFAVAVKELFDLTSYPILPYGNIINYEIGFDDSLNIVVVNIKTYNDTEYQVNSLSEQVLSQMRLRGDFNNKRIFNYLLNINRMYDSLSSLNAIEFYKLYVTNPNVRVVDESVNVSGVQLTADQVKQFRLTAAKNSEKCINLSDIGQLYGAVTETAQIFSDPLYHIFLPNDPKNDVSAPGLKKQLEDNLSTLTKQKEPDLSLPGIFTFTADEFIKDANILGTTLTDGFVKDYSGIVNGLGYILKRLDIQEILLKQVICYLKGLNENDPEVAQIIAQLPNQVLNYISYIQTVIDGDLKGAAWLRAIEQGITFDFELFCSDEFTYFLKGLTALLNSINTGANTAINFITEIDATLKNSGVSEGYRAFNPYGAIAKSVATLVYNTVFDFVFDFLKTLLTQPCDDPLYDNRSDNFVDPFSTHAPISANGTNNDTGIVNKNRGDAIAQIFPEIFVDLRYGVDLEYTVDLIGLLINDIKCILTPSESVNLLKGDPTDEVIIIIRNIIKNKYSKDPNNLSYLLNEDKLKLLFKKLGLTVDQEKLLQTIEEISKIVPSTVCGPQQYQIRCELLNGKLPKELDILQDDLRNRTEKVRNLLDKIKSGEKLVTVSALCPEVEDDAIKEVKGDLAKQYIDSIKSIFMAAINTFTDESSRISIKFSEERNLYRTKGDVIFDQYKYFTYNSTLSKNMHALPIDSTSVDYKKNKSYIIKYQPNDQPPIEEWKLQDILLKTESFRVEIPKDCDKPANYSSDERFLKFLSEGRVIWENRPWNRKWDNIGKEWKDRGGKGTWASQFVQEMYDQSPELYEYIKQKKYVLFINSETSGQYNAKVDEENISREIYQKALYRDLINGELDEKIVLRFLFFAQPGGLDDGLINDIGDFRMLYEAEVDIVNEMSEQDKKKLSKEIRINLANYTGEIISNLEYNKRNEEKFNISNDDFFTKYYPDIKIFYRKDDVSDNRRYGSYVLSNSLLDIVKNKSVEDGSSFELRDGIYCPIGFVNQDTTLNVIQQIFVDNFESSVSAVDSFAKLYNSQNKLKSNGIFNIITAINDKNENIRMVMLPTSTGLEDKPIDYKPYYSVNQTTDKNLEPFINTFQFERFYKSLYDSVNAKLLNIYFKPYFDEREITILNDKGVPEPYDWTNIVLFQSEKDAYYTDLSNEAYKIIKNEKFIDKTAQNIAKLNYFDLSSDIRYRNCNVFPHYLNLNYLLKLAEENIKQSICDTNLEDLPNDHLKDIIIQMVVRVFINDLMIKAVPFLNLLDLSELLQIHKEKFVIDVLREQMKQEMAVFNKNYLNIFVELINELYAKEEFSKKIKQQDILLFSESDNRILEYFMSREIKRFIKFAIEKTIIVPLEISLYRQSDFFKEMDRAAYDIFGTTGAIQDVRTILNLLSAEQLKNEFYTVLIYTLMANTVDFNKRSILVGTKYEVSKILFANINREAEEEIYPVETQEEVVKFINDLSKSQNPSVMISLYPNYSKYIDVFVNALRTQTKNNLLVNAVHTEPNIATTVAVNTSLILGSTMAWSILSTEERNEIMLRASVDNFWLSLLYDRINKGMGPVPQLALSAMAIPFTGLPLAYGLPYLALDAWDEFDWYQNAVKNIEQLKKQALDGQDPCKVTDLNTDLSCKDNKIKLLEEINRFEE